MHTHTFTSAVRGLTGIPQADRDAFLEMGPKLSPEDRERIFHHLASLDADLRKNDQKYSAGVQRDRLAVSQVVSYDIAQLDSLTSDV